MTTIGLLHPGEMGAAIGSALRQRGHEVVWASTGRSNATAVRAREAGLTDAGSVDVLAERSDVILSVCPPHAATAVAASVAGSGALFVDANAIAPATARAIAQDRDAARFVDGGIIGPPPARAGTTRLYLSGTRAPDVAELFDGTAVEACVVSEEIGDASAVKMTYAAWTKGTAALLLAIRAVAEAEGVAEPLLEEWRLERLALGRRDGGDRRDVRRRGPARRLPPRCRGGLPLRHVGGPAHEATGQRTRVLAVAQH